MYTKFHGNSHGHLDSKECLEALLGKACEALRVCEVQGDLGRSQNSHWMPQSNPKV